MDQQKPKRKPKGLKVIEGGKSNQQPKTYKRGAPNEHGLTPKQEAFAQYIAQGFSYADAYRQAYDTREAQDRTIWHNASQLAAKDKVKARVIALQAKYEREALHDGALMRARALAGLMREAQDGDTSAARIRAWELLGKAQHVGLFVERIEQEMKDRSSLEVEQELAERLKRLGKAINSAS